MLTIIKVFIITTLPVRKPWNFLKQISKVSFEVSNQEYSREGGGGCKNGSCIVRLHPPLRARDCHKRCKNLLFCEMSNNPTPLYGSLDPLTNKLCWAWSYMINYLIDSRTCQNRAVKLTTLYLEVLNFMVSKNS